MFLIKNKINIYLYFFFLLFILVFIKFSTTIVFADNYTVKNIKIKEQYDINFNKDEVIKKGFKKGFKTLIFRIVESKDKNLFKNVPSNKINSLIDNFSITNEKFVDNNYEVDFEVKFDKEKLKLKSFSEKEKIILKTMIYLRLQINITSKIFLLLYFIKIKKIYKYFPKLVFQIQTSNLI